MSRYFEKPPTHVLVTQIDTSRAALARDPDYRGNRSPYYLYPERESFYVGGIYERPDGTRYKVVQLSGRWGGRLCDIPGPIKMTEISAVHG